jgi:hypothetical protein
MEYPVGMMTDVAPTVEQLAAALRDVERLAPDFSEHVRRAVGRAITDAVAEQRRSLQRRAGQLESLEQKMSGQASAPVRRTRSANGAAAQREAAGLANGSGPTAQDAKGVSPSPTRAKTNVNLERRRRLAAIGQDGPYDFDLIEDPSGAKTYVVNLMAQKPDQLFTKRDFLPVLVEHADMTEASVERLLQRMAKSGKQRPARLQSVQGKRGAYRLAREEVVQS